MSTYLYKDWDQIDTYDIKFVILPMLILLGVWEQNYRSQSDL